MHGVHEHSERYHHVLALLAASGFVAAAHDQIGHGRSEGLRGDIDKFEDFILDVEAFVLLLRQQLSPKVPLFLWGQSMGGLIAAHVGLRDSRKGDKSTLRGVVITSGALAVQKTLVLSIQEFLSPLLVAVMPLAKMVAVVKPEDMSSDPKEVERFDKDPLNTMGNLRIRLAAQVGQAMKDMEQKAPDFTRSLMVLHGSEDKCTYLPGAENFVEKAGSADKHFQVFQGLYHTMLHEPTWKEVAAHIQKFLERLSAPAGAGRSRL